MLTDKSHNMHSKQSHQTTYKSRYTQQIQQKNKLEQFEET